MQRRRIETRMNGERDWPGRIDTGLLPAAFLGAWRKGFCLNAAPKFRYHCRSVVHTSGRAEAARVARLKMTPANPVPQWLSNELSLDNGQFDEDGEAVTERPITTCEPFWMLAMALHLATEQSSRSLK